MRSLGLVESWPAECVSVGVTRADGVVAAWGPTTERFRWASVTKLLTACAVLVAAEEGILELEATAGPPRSTVRHLLAHASGLPFDPEARVPIAKPGERRIYSNPGFEVLGELVADLAEMPFAEYLEQAVLDPLGMEQARLEGSPAADVSGSLEDLLRFGRELLDPRLIARETLDEATTVAFPGLVGVIPGIGRFDPCDWGLGFELRDAKSPHWTGSRNAPATFGHFGGSGTFLWVDPAAGLALGCLTDLEFGPWALEAWPALSDAVLEELRP